MIAPGRSGMPAPMQKDPPQTPPPLPLLSRPDQATAAIIEQGIVIWQHQGRAAAEAYLRQHSVAGSIILRVLSPGGYRRVSKRAGR